jgi:hypothetical protein
LTNEEYKTRLLNLLLADLESSNNDNEEEESDELSPMDKRMSYRYGKRMSYRYGKRSAMPYRFGKRALFYESSYPSAQQLIDYIKLHENDEEVSKRMSYRYGRSADK